MQASEGAEYTSVTVGEKLARLSPLPPERCVHRVHNQLRCVNEKAYEPVIIAIGPYHHGIKNLQMMEEIKLRYLQLLLQRKNDCWKKYFNAITPLEPESRKFYAEPIRQNGNELIEMMLLGGCFIIELFKNFYNIDFREVNDPIFNVDWIVNSLQRDLLLFENQLPFSILCKLFDLIKHPNQHNKLTYLALRFFYDILPGPGYSQHVENSHQYQSKHLRGLIHENWLPSFAVMKCDRVVTNKKTSVFIPCATKLREVGIEFEMVEGAALFDRKFPNTEEGETSSLFYRKFVKFEEVEAMEDSLFDIKFGKGRRKILCLNMEEDRIVSFFRKFTCNLFYIMFQKAIIQIPHLTTEGRTVSFFRNLIVYEQYDPDHHLSYITDYVKFMDCLIDTPQDVELLRRYGIIDNLIGDNQVVSSMFNKIRYSVIRPSNNDVQYARIFNDVNNHCNTRIQQWMANLRGNYCNSPWSLINFGYCCFFTTCTHYDTDCIYNFSLQVIVRAYVV